MNDGIGLSNRKQLLDLRQNFLYCLMTIAGDQNHTVKNFLEGRLPGRIELAIRFDASIVKILRTSKLAGLEGTIANIIGDVQLYKQNENCVSFAVIIPPFHHNRKTDQIQAGLSEGDVDTAQFQKWLVCSFLRSVLLALLDLFMVF